MQPYCHAVQARLCCEAARQAGFATVRETALDTLADVLGAYISSLARDSRFATARAQRTDTNIHDVLYALAARSHASRETQGHLVERLLSVARSHHGWERAVPPFPVPARAVGRAHGVSAVSQPVATVLTPEATRSPGPLPVPADRDPKLPSFLPPLPPEFATGRTEAKPCSHVTARDLQARATQQRRTAEIALSRLRSRPTCAAGEPQRKRRCLRPDEAPSVPQNPYLDVAKGISGQCKRVAGSTAAQSGVRPVTPTVVGDQYARQLLLPPPTSSEVSARVKRDAPQSVEAVGQLDLLQKNEALQREFKARTRCQEIMSRFDWDSAES
eukprot:TRINITY_DN81467_c0_g1_i1.p1 TRINITY_DN81467_c0_g1~~TRINITY_DN81467_c0_g1_i1.p1  ORF type:complete len:329 (+),score=19.86 TRINITY_DN81467_c0_g1_i1:106-1092(+)